MTEEAAEQASRDLTVVIPGRAGEVRISLHPISLALVVAELIEDAANTRCRKRGHRAETVENESRYCTRCGTSLPDSGSPYRSWLPDAYRTIVRRTSPGLPEGGGESS